ncbi:type II secretion system F family protein [Vibrio europaeus]|uniref:Pilus assembly protein TadB n=2 Tax=Vibrio oreintalis group TaxID=1891919 RepID=A0A178JBQ1_9VIBR|nr:MULTISPECIES: type II secretion system F family protein [Vibrio oreintalis group]MDC5703315.1 type II secretion system F family protein [Vibrio europaeus]MDC5711530.1 type II secretion system F family protein [Vibrio europaeus]MDC5715023.1 type II secretion system F family protein [Vibrio europaeus]MDC5722039.1 type II secretion system F family protein [Vibrio europaeus]MDC5727641.1 type II secretion system F family protein [Vibrio europaeus]
MQQDATLFFILLFFAVVFISQALILPAAGSKAKHKELSQRLKESQTNLDEEARSLLQEHYIKSLTPLDRRLIKIEVFSSLKKMIELSGYDWSLTQTLTVTSLFSAIAFIIALIFKQPIYVGMVAAVGVWFILYFWLNKKISDRLAAFEEQLPEALDIMRRMLQAGQPVTQAFNEVGNEMPAPIGVEFKNTFNLLNYGYDMRMAIMQMAERTPTVSMLAFSSAVLLQKETGGNLSENLEKVSRVLRARFKLQRKIKTLSAESRLSAWILVLSPFILFLFLTFMDPEYVEPLYRDPRGMDLVSGGIVSLFIGSMWIRKIINFEV